MDLSSLWLISFTVTAASTQMIRLPSALDTLQSCTTRSGVLGACVDIRLCVTTRRSLRRDAQVTCGFNGTFPVVCCTAATGNIAGLVQDISPPTVDFECGNDTVKIVRLQRVTTGPVRILRPPNSLTFPGNTTRNPEKPVVRAGFSAGVVVTHIVGGAVVLQHSWPWMALVGEADDAGFRWFCGGVLINAQWVLTALHCFFHNTAEIVRLGEHDYNDDDDGADHHDIMVAETVNFPNFASPEAYHDLALLRLASPITIQRYISPVCLPWGSESGDDVSGQQATLAGWGDTLFGGRPSSILQEVNVTVFPSTQCDSSYSALPHYADTWPRGIGPETLCAGDPAGGRDACQGDSGGPLMTQDSRGRSVLAGIASQGYGCGHKDYPGLYVNVRHPPYLAWIKRVAFS